jgi:integrase
MASRRLRLSEAADRYSTHCKARNLAPSTIKGQQTALGLFRKVTGDLLLDSITGAHIDLVFNTYNWAHSTRNNRIGQYRAFFNWCRGSRFMNPMLNPMIGWRQSEPPQIAHLRIPFAEWPRLFEACQHPQERILVATGLFLFLRASEQQALRIRDVELQENRVTVWRSKIKKHQVMPIPSELEGEIRTWLTYLSENYEVNGDHHFICARNKDMKHHPVTHLWIAGSGTLNLNRPVHKPHLIVQRVLKRAGYKVEKGQGEHTLRRSGARAYFDHLVTEGYDGALRQVQTLLGHRHSRMTEVYLGIDLDQQRVLESLAGRPMFPVGGNLVPIRSVAHV